VDLFLLLSGYGLTVAMLKKRLPVLAFYRRRLIKVVIPLWVALAALFVADAVFLRRLYPPLYVLQSFFGIFPNAIPTDDVNSPLWYISWLLMFYVLFPLLFMPQRPWLTAILLAVIANAIAIMDPLHWQADWLQRLHTNAFPLGILLAWALHEHKAGRNPLLEKLKEIRRGEGMSPPFRYALLIMLTALAAYMAGHNQEGDWPRLAGALGSAGLDEHFIIGQVASLLTMAAAVAVFSLKNLEFRLLSWFGEYSYEIYLLHWPLLARYDWLFHALPAWLALLCWLAALIGIGHVLQSVTASLTARFEDNGNDGARL
jgi:peptidoglycan/LPS O-acetylase OafA/YrhL